MWKVSEVHGNYLHIHCIDRSSFFGMDPQSWCEDSESDTNENVWERDGENRGVMKTSW